MRSELGNVRQTVPPEIPGLPACQSELILPSDDGFISSLSEAKKGSISAKDLSIEALNLPDGYNSELDYSGVLGSDVTPLNTDSTAPSDRSRSWWGWGGCRTICKCCGKPPEDDIFPEEAIEIPAVDASFGGSHIIATIESNRSWGEPLTFKPEPPAFFALLTDSYHFPTEGCSTQTEDEFPPPRKPCRECTSWCIWWVLIPPCCSDDPTEERHGRKKDILIPFGW